MPADRIHYPICEVQIVLQNLFGFELKFRLKIFFDRIKLGCDRLVELTRNARSLSTLPS